MKILLIYLLILCSSCCSFAQDLGNKSQQIKLVRGSYELDLTDGWKNIHREDGSHQEIIPGPTHKEYLTIKRFHRFTYKSKNPGIENISHAKGRWEVNNDTLILTFIKRMKPNRQKMKRKIELLIQGPCHFKKINVNQYFYRVEPECNN